VAGGGRPEASNCYGWVSHGLVKQPVPLAQQCVWVIVTACRGVHSRLAENDPSSFQQYSLGQARGSFLALSIGAPSLGMTISVSVYTIRILPTRTLSRSGLCARFGCPRIRIPIITSSIDRLEPHPELPVCRQRSESEPVEAFGRVTEEWPGLFYSRIEA
jgi:hypothetical protein